VDTLPYPTARACEAFLGQLDRFGDALATLSDDDLLAPSRCRGWAVCDLVAHVHLGLQEMLCGFATTTDANADTDFASYWGAYPGAGAEDHSAVAQTRFLRLLSSAYSRPGRLVEHLGQTRGALTAVARRAGDGDRVAFQGLVLPVGDFIATWVVELAVHHLDAAVELPDLPPPTPEALAVTRETLDALAPGLPDPGWDQVTTVLKGTGRLPLDDAERQRLGPAAARFPLLG
jgi:uncharacterized protein (TIGR03083 family)